MSQVYELNGIRATLPKSGDYWIAPGTYVIGNVIFAEGQITFVVFMKAKKI